MKSRFTPARVRLLSLATALLLACAAIPTFSGGPDVTTDGGADASADTARDSSITCRRAVRTQGSAACGTAPSGSLAIARGPLSAPLMSASSSDLFYIVNGALVQRPLAAWGIGSVVSTADSASDAAVGDAAVPPLDLSLDACPLSASYTFTPDELSRVKKLLPFGDAGVCIVMDAGSTDAGPQVVTDAGKGSSYEPHALSVLCSVDGHGPYLPLANAIAQQSDVAVKNAGPIRLADSFRGVLYWISEIPASGKRPSADAIFSWEPTTVPRVERVIGDDTNTACNNLDDCSHMLTSTKIGACQNFPNHSTHFSAGGGLFETLSAAAPTVGDQLHTTCQVPTWNSVVGASAGIAAGFSTSIREDGLIGFDKKNSASLRIAATGDAVFRGLITPPGYPSTCATPQCFYGAFIPGAVQLVAVPLGGREVLATAVSGDPAEKLIAFVTEGVFPGDYDIRVGSGFDGASAQRWASRFSAVRSKVQGSRAMSLLGVGHEFLIAVTARDGAACSQNDGFIARFAP